MEGNANKKGNMENKNLVKMRYNVEKNMERRMMKNPTFPSFLF